MTPADRHSSKACNRRRHVSLIRQRNRLDLSTEIYPVRLGSSGIGRSRGPFRNRAFSRCRCIHFRRSIAERRTACQRRSEKQVRRKRSRRSVPEPHQPHPSTQQGCTGCCSENIKARRLGDMQSPHPLGFVSQRQPTKLD